MATALDALLRIKAQVTGAPAVQALGGAIGGVQKSATGAVGALQRMGAASGGLGGALGALTPLLSAAGLGAMAKGAIDAADNMNDLSQKTGVSVEQLSRFQQAANSSGTSIDAVGGAMVKLNRNLATRNDNATAALTSLGISATDASGKLKSADQVMLEVADKFSKMEDGANKSAAAQALFGKSGADMIPMLNGGRQAIEQLEATMSGKFAKSSDAFNDKLEILQSKLRAVGTSLGEALLPHLEKAVDALIAAAKWFGSLPAPLQSLIIAVGALSVAFVLLAPAITAIVSLVGVLSGIGLAATIAGWLGALGPFIAGLAAVVAGFITWPVIIGVALVAAAVLIYAFRDKIGAFFQQVGRLAVEGWRMFTEAAGNAFQWLIDQIVALPGRVANGAKAIGNAIGNGIANAVKGIFRGMLQWMANGINGIAGQINRLIRAYNKLPGPDIGELGMVSVPKFARGGYVTSPTLGLVGEAGREYIVPEAKAPAFANNIMAGRRGSAAIPSGSSSGGGSGAVSINITTGPIRQDASGQRWMTIEDGEKMVRQAVGQMQRTSRTPAGRYASGVR